MSNLLWKYYLEDDVEKFRRLLANANHNPQHSSKGHGGGAGNVHSMGSVVGSPGGFGTSPRTVVKNRKASGQHGNTIGSKGAYPSLSRAELNSRDHAGLTVLHRAVSSTSANAINFALALIEHPAIDLYVQDTESGWTALHRALYFGNVLCARAIIEKDSREPSGPGNAAQRAVSSVIKIKDHEGNSPFDVYNATIARRTLKGNEQDESDDGSQDEAHSITAGFGVDEDPFQLSIGGDEIYSWGTNKNYSLGFGDEDNRQHPEKIMLKRPDHLLFRFYQEHLESMKASGAATNKLKDVPKSVSELPSLVQNRPLLIQDVALSKLHSAILTTDPVSNLHMCGFGPGGRLGTGDEVTRFAYVCIEEGGLAGKKVLTVALGQNHTMAVSSEGEIFSWGTNTYGQLGYTLPRPAMKDEEPVCTTPRQIFGPLKREKVIGVAASAFHSVAHTSTSLFTWGKNEGQLGLIDSDSRSLDVQNVPRKVAASLFKAPIAMISAINAATICLLANHTVCVFTNYGYNIVKFPLHEGFSNYHLKSDTLTTRYDSMSNHISSITAGGETIAAVSSRGDLFTVNVTKMDTNPSSASTTNPSKIKGALSQPQRIWSLRKGNWDGIKSVGITENGSVIVCTQAGAVWRRVKRANIKDTYTGIGAYSPKDFKFQRIPGLTKVAAVRSTTFGVYAAIRKDCDVTKTQILVEEQNLWDEIAPLLSIRDLRASDPLSHADSDTPRFWTPALPKELFNPLKRAILTSPDLESDISGHLLNVQDMDYDFEVCTTNSDPRIPVHGFMLARSPILRDVMGEFRRTGTASVLDVLAIAAVPTQGNGSLFGFESPGKPRIIFQGLDIITIVNLVVYLYSDKVIDVWHFTRQCPKMAFRYRQVRVELMKTAAQLKLNKLEAAVRLMTEPDPRMDLDLAVAIQDTQFFEDGDTIIELDGSEVMAHSSFLCQRCPFFEGLFKGRAGGQWLANRRQDASEAVRVDLKHIAPATFNIVLRYLYADIGSRIFDEVVAADVDEFSELVMDVMGVANELMLDRLAQVCQQTLGRFVTTRNVSQLLNVVSPVSVTGFKDSALEYVCLQLEAMLENHLLDDLDEDLLLELDEVVRSNQLNCLPFAKSGRAELLLHERYPSLAGDIDEERQRRLRDMTFRANLRDEDSRLSSSFRARVGSLDDIMSSSPSQDKARRKSKAARNAPFSPSIRPKDSTVDLMFDMDDDNPLAPGSPQPPPLKPALDLTPNSRLALLSPKVSGEEMETGSLPHDEPSALTLKPAGLGINNTQEPTTSRTKTWSTPALPSSKLDMREIMAQASSSRTSNLSISLSAQKFEDEEAKKAASVLPKLSQKERKKLQQQVLQQTLPQPQISLDKSNGKPSSPWQVASRGPKTSLKEVLDEAQSSPSPLPPKSLGPPMPSRPLTPRRTASPDTRFSGQQRSVSSNVGKSQSSSSANFPRPMTQSTPSKSAPIVPHSKPYTSPASKAEPSLQLSMADIIGQQRREQEVIKEAVAKKSLQEIQEEQAFQEWWDQESRRAQEEEAARSKAPAVGRSGKTGGGRGKGGNRGREGRGDAVQSRGGGRGRGQGKGTNPA